MTKLLLYIKYHLPFIWNVIELLNALLYRFLCRKKVLHNLNFVFDQYNLKGFIFRRLEKNDMPLLENLLARQSPARLEYFKPHAYDLKALNRTISNPAFLMMGVFEDSNMVGYFFLRCFWNKKCFVGRLIDQPSEGKGIGRVMNNIMYNTAWRSGFRCLSTISKNNKLVMRSHSNNKAMKIIKSLPNDYLLVEFVKPD